MTRADLTVTAVEKSGDSSLEEALDDSAALRDHPMEVVSDALPGEPYLGNRTRDIR